MVMKPEPIFSAIDALRSTRFTGHLYGARWELLTSELARDLANQSHLVLPSGHYEG